MFSNINSNNLYFELIFNICRNKNKYQSKDDEKIIKIRGYLFL